MFRLRSDRPPPDAFPFDSPVNIDYREWPPCAALSGVVLAYWSVAGDGSSVPSPTILPDAYVEIVINLGDDVMLERGTFTGIEPARAVVGLLETAIEMRYPRDLRTFGIRLHPAHAATFLNVPARTLLNTVRPLDQVSRPLDEQLSRAIEAHAVDAAQGRDAV